MGGDGESLSNGRVRMSGALYLDIRAVELGKFDPPLGHAPYGRIV